MDGSGLLDFAKVIIGAGLGSGVATLLLAWRKHRLDGTYLAMRLAVLFEAYAKTCAGLVSANEHAEHRRDEEFPDWDTSLPKLPTLPDDADGWKALDANDASACLGFAALIEDAQSVVDGLIEHTPHDLGEATQEEAGKLGLEAFAIASRLRRAHKLKPITLRLNYQQVLRGEVSKGLARRRRGLGLPG